MSRVFQIVCVAAIVAALGSAAMAVDIVTVPVGNANNTADTRYATPGYGAVSYAYNIGKYEVTAGQYRDFLNAVDPNGANPYGLYNSSMNSSSYGCQITWNSGSNVYDFSGAPSGTAADWENRPVNYVSFWDAARFANWLHNGQGAGDTETGAYTLTSDGMSANTITRNAGATWVVTSEDEWYKAAYYSGSGSTYYDYPTSSDTAPGYVNNSGNLSGTGAPFTEGGTDPGNYATYDGDGGTNGIGPDYYRTEVGEWENSDSPYVTFDQGGNVWEWNEAITLGSYRGLRGGSFSGSGSNLLASYRNSHYYPASESNGVGFRVSEVPEPGTMALLMLGGIGILRRRKGAIGVSPEWH